MATVTLTYKTSEQTVATLNVPNATRYAIQSQPSGGHFSINGKKLLMKAGTPVGTYSHITIKAFNSRGSGVGNLDYTVVVNKATNPITYAAQSWSPSFSTSAQTKTLNTANSAQGTVTYSLQSQKQGSTAVTHFGFNPSTRVLTMGANTPPNTYTVVIRAHAVGNNNYDAGHADSIVTVTVSKADISPTITMANWAYGGTASTPSVSGNSGSGTVTYKYKLKSAADSTYSTTKPSDAGTYTIQATIAATTNYNGKTVTKDFSITFTATPTAYSAAYNGSAHSASIKTSAPGVVVSYGTSTSYGYSVTCTNANTNYTMSSVTRTTVSNTSGLSGATTVYYSATKNGYTVTGTTTITISRVSAGAKPTTAVSKTYTGNSLNNDYTTPTGVSMSGNNSGTTVGTYTATYTPDGNHKWSDNTYAAVSVTLTITKATPTFTVTVATLNYTGSAQTLVSAASVSGNGTIYYGLGSSTTSAPSSWSTTKPTATNVGSYYVWAKADTSTNYNAVTQVYKGTAVIKPVMYLKFHANGGTIADSPHKYSDTQYFKLNNSIVQGSSTSGGTYSDIITTINTSTTYINLWNITSYNITRTGYSYTGTAAFNTAANGSGISVNQDNDAATDTNPITTKRLNGGTEITANVTKTLYVNWVEKTALLTYNATGLSGATVPSQVTMKYTTATNLTAGTAPSGYSFYGWATSEANAKAGTRAYTGTQQYKAANVVPSAATLYAIWYGTVTYNANGHGTAPSSQTMYYNSATTAAAISATGYTFSGWNTKSDGSGTSYAAGASIKSANAYKSNITLYAQWTINSYTLTIDPNGGTWNSSTSTSTASQNYNTTKSIAAPTRIGYVFIGWAETGAGRLGKINQADPAFDSSSGGVGVYNNSSNGAVTHTRQSSSAGTAYGGYEILIKASSSTTSPGNGGFVQSTTSAANQKYIHVFVAKIPVGYTVQHAENATGDGRTIQWLTSRKGTGAYQVYAYQHNCGSSGTFSTFGHVYLDTGSKPVSWQLAYSAMTNITNGFADTYTYGAGAGRLTALWAPIVPVHMNINGTWKTGPVWLNINGTWKQALEGYINVNGTWKQIK